MEPTASPPTVSVVTATYNRSNVLRYAIASLMRSSFNDWELLVIGDACTDDTADVVASFRDPRVSFHNLDSNVGEQSGPNNEGARRARGRYLALLNHDDLWLANHLETALAGLSDSNADLVSTLGLVIGAGARRRAIGISPTGRYEPWLEIPASLWLLRRELHERLGGWRSYRQCRAVPSQDFLVRAWKTGATMKTIEEITAICIQSGPRRGCYARREDEENRVYFERLCQEPNLLERELLALAIYKESQECALTVWPWFRRGLAKSLHRAFRALGIPPVVGKSFLMHPGRRRRIDALRETRGLPPIQPPRGKYK